MMADEARINLKVVKKHKQATLKHLADMEGINFLPEKRMTEIFYRGTPYQFKVKSIWFQVDVLYDAVIKGEAVACGDLDAMLCENDLVKTTTGGVAGKIDPVYLKPSRSVRLAVNRHIGAATEGDGLAVSDHFKAEETRYSTTDGTIVIESRFFQAMNGDAGEAMLQSKVLEVLPSNKGGRSLAGVEAALTQICGTGLYKFAGAGPQGSIKNVQLFLTDIKAGRGPAFPRNASEFLVEVKTRLAYFCTIGVGTKKLIGEEAAKHCAAEALKKAAPTLKDLEIPVTYSWLLPRQQATQIETARKAAMPSGVSIGAAASSAQEAKRKRALEVGSASSSAKPAKAKKTEVEQAMSMFGGIGVQ